MKRTIFLFLIAFLGHGLSQSCYSGKVLFDRQTSMVISPKSYFTGYMRPIYNAIDKQLIAACKEMEMYDYKGAPANFYIIGMEIFQDRIYPICKQLELDINNVFDFMKQSIEVIQCSASGAGYTEGVNQILSTVKSIHAYLKSILGEIIVHARIIPCPHQVDRIRRIERAKDLAKTLSKLLIFCFEQEERKRQLFMVMDELHPLVVRHFCEHRNNHMSCLEETRPSNNKLALFAKISLGATFTIVILWSAWELARRF